MDDVDGQCGNGPYPLLHAVSDVFNINSNNPSRMKEEVWFEKSNLIVWF